MQPRCIVVGIEETAQIRAQVVNITVLGAADFLLLERLHKALAFGVVVRIARPAHARDDAMCEQRIDVSGRSILGGFKR